MVGKWHLGHYKEEFTPTRQASVMLAKAMLFDEPNWDTKFNPTKVDTRKEISWLMPNPIKNLKARLFHPLWLLGRERGLLWPLKQKQRNIITVILQFLRQKPHNINRTTLTTEIYQVVIVLCSSKNISGKLWWFFNLICVIVLCRLYYMGYITTIQCFMCYVNFVNIFVFSKLFKMCICKMNLYLHLGLQM